MVHAIVAQNLLDWCATATGQTRSDVIQLLALLNTGPPVNWPKPSEWEQGFDLSEAHDEYAEGPPLRRPQTLTAGAGMLPGEPGRQRRSDGVWHR